MGSRRSACSSPQAPSCVSLRNNRECRANGLGSGLMAREEIRYRMRLRIAVVTTSVTITTQKITARIRPTWSQ